MAELKRYMVDGPRVEMYCGEDQLWDGPDPGWYPAPDTDAALAARDKRITELEEWQAEARDALVEADKHLASLQQVDPYYPQISCSPTQYLLRRSP